MTFLCGGRGHFTGFIDRFEGISILEVGAVALKVAARAERLRP